MLDASRAQIRRMARHLVLLDFGSNAVRFVLARFPPAGGFVVIDESRVRTRLAWGEQGKLNEAALEQNLRAARRFLKRARKHEPDVLAVATATVRDAPTAELLNVRLLALGVGELRILSGLEEARLGAEAALRRLSLQRGAVIDLGGGSLQWTAVRDKRLGAALSVPLGAARLTREYLRHDPATERELSQLRAAARSQLQAVLPSSLGVGSLIALGGTAHALARRKLREGKQRLKKRHAAKLARLELSRLRARLEVLSIDQRKTLRGLRPWRADIVVADAVVLEELMQLAGYRELTVCTASVREGVLWREARRLRK
jgi:exopolyphosphatase/guanosine-5'-triphosphate,3'-diphosphate pyrophosphatase